jgi:hypothetical protein
MSSDFFASVSGNIRFTDSRINGGGPLPDDLRGGPEGSGGIADGRYNATAELLSNIEPYALPGKGNLNANSNYREKARRAAMCIPGVMLPEPGVDAESTFAVYHAVDNGDIAFVVKPVSSRKYSWLFAKPYPAQSTKHADNLVNVNVFLNVVQVNYVLAGITNRLWHLYEKNEALGHVAGKNTWDTLISSFGKYVDNFVKNMLAPVPGVAAKDKDLCRFFLQSRFLLQHIVQFHIMPFGICAGSEKQGGQHEARNKPVQAATSHFTTMTVDGQNRDLVNFWRNVDIDGGDQLILYLGPVRRGGNVPYTLNHWSKGTVSKLVKFEEGLLGCTLQIIPSFYKAGAIEDHSTQGKERDFVLGQLVSSVRDADEKKICKSLIASAMDYRVAGYWHCGQTYTKSSRFGLTSAPCSDAEYMTGALLQVNWAPVWKSGGLLEWFEEARFARISDKIKNGRDITECYVTEYDHTYMEVLYATDDLLGSLGKRRRTTSVEMSTDLSGITAPPANVAAEMSTALPGITAPPANVAVEMSTALPGIAAPPANVAAEMGTALPGIAAPSAASKSAIDALGAEMPGSTFVPVQLQSRLASDLGGDQAGPSKAKTSKRMAIPKISFLDAKESEEELELQRIFTAKGQQ